MNRKELIAEFEKNVAYMRRIIPPDDIYPFAEQTFMAAMHFLYRWAETTSLEDMTKNPVTKRWIDNIVGLHELRKKGEDTELSLDLDWPDEDHS